MAITLLEYNQRLNGVINDLQSGAHGEVMTQVASDAIVLVKQRVQEKGLTPEGAKYTPYSKSYQKQKEKQGKYRGFVDFTLSGRMWTNTKITSPKGELDSGVAVVKPTTRFEQDKLNWNTEKRGEILALSADEKRQLVHNYEQGILNIFRKNRLL